MSLPRRDYLESFEDGTALSDLRRVVRAMQAEVDHCDPEECMHDLAMVHPIEVVYWIEDALNDEKRRPVRFEKGHRPRTMKAEQLNLAIA